MPLADLLDFAAYLDQYAALCRRSGDGRGAGLAGDLWMQVTREVKQRERAALEAQEKTKNV